MENKNWTVYMHTSPSGKKYIGITCQSLNSRWKSGKGYKGSPHFFLAIKKYGWDNIRHEVLFQYLSQKEANEKEIELISFYKSNNKKYGYNIEGGGNSTGKMSEETKLKLKNIHLGKKMSEETKIKLSKAHKGKKLSEETKQRMSKSQKGRKHSIESRKKMSNKQKGSKNGFYGKHHTEDAKKSMSEKRRGVNNGFYGKTFSDYQKKIISERFSKKIMCVETKKIYKNAKEASISLGHINRGTNIQNAVNNYNKTAYGYHWRYVC